MKFDKIRRALSFLDFKEGWDSYDASQINPASLKNAIQFVLEHDEKELFQFFPVNNGNVSISYDNGEHDDEKEFYYDIEFFPETVAYLIKCPKYGEIEINEENDVLVSNCHITWFPKAAGQVTEEYKFQLLEMFVCEVYREE